MNVTEFFWTAAAAVVIALIACYCFHKIEQWLAKRRAYIPAARANEFKTGAFKSRPFDT